MENSLEELKNYFTRIEKLYLLWEAIGKKINKSLTAIENLSDQLQAACSGDSNTRISAQFPSIQGQVIYMTLMSLEQELSSILSIAKEIEEATEKLNRTASLFDQQFDCTKFISSLVPVHSIIEAAIDCRQYYQARWAELHIAIICLNFRDWNSIKNLRRSFAEDKDLKRHVERSLMLVKHFTYQMEIT